MKEIKEEQEGRFSSSLFNWGEALVVSILFVVIVFTFIIRLIGVSGSSMVPTLQDGDIMLVSNLFYEPEQGDIIVLNKSTFGVEPGQEPIVKRVIAVAGDEVDIDFAQGEVWVNGEKLDEPYINEPTYTQGDMTFPVEVPEGNIFVLGDNRNASTDSRWSMLGMVDERYIIGQALAVILPFDAIGGLVD